MKNLRMGEKESGQFKHLCGGTEKTHDNLLTIPDQESNLWPFENDAWVLISTPRCSQGNFLDFITRILRFYLWFTSGGCKTAQENPLNGKLPSNELERTKERGRGLIFGTIQAFAWTGWKKIHENSVKSIMSRSRFKTGISGIQVAWSNMLDVWLRVSSSCNIYILELFCSP